MDYFFKNKLILIVSNLGAKRHIEKQVIFRPIAQDSRAIVSRA